MTHDRMFYYDLAVGLMRQHGLESWTFEFDNAKRRAGVCRYRCKLISLSRHYVRLNADNYEDIRDTILHEIAHALAGFKAAHGPAWKAVCRRIGAKPERCYDSSKVVMPKGSLQATCGGCLTVFTRHKAVRKGSWRYCVKCGKDKGRLTFTKRVESREYKPSSVQIRSGQLSRCP